MKKSTALVLKIFIITALLVNEAMAQTCTEATNVNGIAGTGFSNGTIGQSFTACKTGKLGSVSVQAGNASSGFNNVIVQIFSGDGFGGSLLATSGQVHVKANRTTTFSLSSLNIQVVEGQKYTARFLTQSGSPMMAYGTYTNTAVDYYPRGRIHGAAQAHNDMFFTAVIESLGTPTLSPADDAVAVTRDTQVKMNFSREMEAVSGDITINNITDGTSQTVDVTTLTIDGTEVLMPLSNPLEGGKDFEIIIPANALRSTNQLSYTGLASGEWTFSTSTSPYANLTTTSPDLTNVATIPFEINFSDVVTGFDLSDLVIANGVASNLTGSDDAYTFDVTASADGEVVVALPANVVEAGASNGNDSTGYVLAYDGTVPSVSLDTDASGTIQISVFDIEVVFSEPVVGFEPSDLVLTNAEVLSSVSTKDSLFTVSLRAQSEGQITVDLPAEIADDLAGNANTAAPAIIDVTYSVDLESNLLSYYPFNGNADDTVSTGFNGTISGATLTTGFDGTVDGAYNFDGSDIITFGDTPIGAGSFTLAFWVKIPEGIAQNQVRTILGKRVVCGEGRFFEIGYVNSSTNGHQLTVEQRNNASVANPVANLSSVGEWMHIAYVKDNEQSQSSFYVNGVQQTPVAWTSVYNFENTTNLVAGRSACDGNGRFKMLGDMDDLYVYGRALSGVEIDLLAPFTVKNTTVASGSEIQAGQSIGVTFNKNILKSSINTTNVTATGSVTGSVNLTLSASQDGVSIVAPAGWPIDEDVTISFSGVIAENGTTLPDTDLTYSVIADEAVGLILHYPISGNVNEAIGEIANQDGTITGALFTEGVDGDPFGALSFDGTDDVVTLGDAPITSETFSMSMWLKVPTDGSTTANTIILSKRAVCSEGRMINFYYQRSDDKFRLSVGLRDNASAGGVSTGFDFAVDEWVNVAFVKDNSTQKYRLIVNGNLEAEANWTLGTVNIDNSTALTLGATPCNGVNGEQRFDGLLDDLRIYDRVIKPRIVSVEPSKGTVNAATDTVVTISFDRAVDTNSLEASTVSLVDNDGVNYTYTTAFSSGDSVLTITPEISFPKGKTITVSVDTISAVVGGDFLPFQTSFTTVFSQLLSNSPLNGTSDVDSVETISFKFDNAMDMASLESGIKVIGSQHGAVEGSFSMPTTDSIVFTPSTPYFPNEVITVYMTSSLTDEGGEAIGNSKTFSFHVGSPQFVNPTLSFELTQLSTGTTNTSSPGILVPGDIDNDGDLDLIGGDDNARALFFFENIGSGNYSEGQIIDTNNSYFDIKVSDFDLDGDMDIVTVDRAVSQGVYWYENDGSGGFTEHLIVALPNSDSRSIAIADYNKDGNLDVAVVSYGSNRLSAFEADGTQLFAAANVGGPIYVETADRDNDGDMDLYVGNYTTGNVASFANSGNGTFSGSALHSASQVRAVIPIDFDKDGDIDIVYSAENASQIGILENNGNFTYTNHQVGSVGGPHRIDVGDIEGDGDFDIIYTVASGASEMNFYYLENSGAFGLWVPKKLIDTETFNGTFTQTAKFADIDKDGDLDVLATDAASGFFIFENKIIDLNEAPIVSNPIADQTLEEDATTGLTIDVSTVFTDNDGDSFTLSASADNAAVTAVINGDNLELNVIEANFFGTVNITLTADDGNGVNNDVFVLEVVAVNDAPVFDLSLTVVTVEEDFTTTETIILTQNQPDNEDAPTYSLSPASISFADVSIDAVTGDVSINAIADGFGSQEFTITADDGASESNTATQSFTLTVNAVNDAPIVANAISDVAFDEDPTSNQTVDISNAFSDVDDESLTLSHVVISGSDLATVTLANGMIDIVAEADAFGTVQVEVTAEDAAGATVTDQFDIVINPVNDAPTFTTSGDLTLNKDFTGTETVTVTADEVAFGEDAQVVTYSLSPSSVSFANVSFDQSTGEVSITAIASAFGTQEFTITADDGEAANNTATQVFTLTILDNLAPVVINTIADTSMDEDQTTLSVVDVTTLFSDPENDPLTFSVGDDFNGSVSAVVNGNFLEVTPVANFNGVGTVTVSASDGNQTASTSFTLTVNSINDIPTVELTLSAQQATEDVSFSFTLPTGLFADVDGDVVTLSANASPAWLSFNGAVFTGTPTNSDVATSTIEVVGSDGNGGSATATFDLTVVNVNDAPTVIAPLADVTVDEDSTPSTISLTGVFEDIDAGDQLTLFATAGETSLISLVLNEETLEVGYKADVSGAVTVTLTATDGSGASATNQFTVTVNSVNDAPIFDLSQATVDLEENFTAAVSVSILAGDVPLDEMDQTVTYTVSSDDTGIVNATLNDLEIELTAIAEAFGEQTFTVTADDGQSVNNIHVMTFTVTVNQVLSTGDLANKLSIYPNPVTDYVMIDTNELVNVRVYGMNGQIIKSYDQVTGRLDVSDLNGGTYLMEVSTPEEAVTIRIHKAN